MFLKIVLVVFSCVIGITVGQLRCYACGFSSVDSDQSCMTITNDTRTVDCRFQYCTILRQDFVDPGGVVASFTRGCEQQPDFLNHEVIDSSFKTYYRACTSDLCNIGNGIESIVGGNLSPQPQYTGGNLLVPGTRSSAITIKNSLLIMFISFLVQKFV
ncbi:uncharacterized protein LOC142974795 [Anticarsia gemmatalis]|uniref:uncharacterized protein LOC142974795 n=1 Tax=Anticarsia gemmatalis TaxID=129554 RepID=UPI003F770D8E